MGISLAVEAPDEALMGAVEVRGVFGRAHVHRSVCRGEGRLENVG